MLRGMGAKAKAKTKAKTTSAAKKSAKKPAAKKKAATAKKKPAAAKPAAKPAAPPRRRGLAKTIQLPPRDPFVPQSVPVDVGDDAPALDFDDQPTPPPKKPGAFARIGNLFARMTGKKGTEPPPLETTEEIVTGDIVAETEDVPPPTPSKKRSKAV
jgi:hypothetical protein